MNQKLGNEYVLLKELGSGGFADVYKARHIGLGYIRAIRILRQFVPDETSPIYQKFLRECRVLLRLGNGCHPNIVHIYQPRLVEGKPLVEMDYVEGVDLKDYIAEQNGKVPVEEIVRMVREMGSALAYCHHDIYKVCYNRDEDNLQDDPEDGSKVLITGADERRLIEKYRVIHNDIQTRNIMRRGSDGMYVLLDFGLAVDGNGDVVGSSRMSKGAPEFKPPEKWDNEDLPTTQGDIYSFGCVVYAMITGQPPFPIEVKKGMKSVSSADLIRVMMAHKEQVPPPIEREDVPQWLVELTMRCLEKDPARRYSDGYEMYQEILHYSQMQANEPLPNNPAGEETEIDTSGTEGKSSSGREDNPPITQPVQKNKKSTSNRFWKILFWILLSIAILAAAFCAFKFIVYPQINNKKVVEISVGDQVVRMMHVEGGTFLMGAQNRNPSDVNFDADAYKWEGPVHSVTLDDYYIGETEVTQGLWMAVMGYEPVTTNGGWEYGRGTDCPVYRISYKEVQDFIKRLNQMTGYTFRLPTEAEWEFAARGGNRSHNYKYCGSDGIEEVAWYWRNTGNQYLSGSEKDVYSWDLVISNNCKVHPVKEKMPNELGLYDMSGNVSEWCSDWFGKYDNYSQTNPTGPSLDTCRVYRGGSWFNGQRGCRVTFRKSNNPEKGNSGIGFRLALSR